MSYALSSPDLLPPDGFALGPLMAEIDRDGRVSSPEALEALVRLIEQGPVPPRLRTCVLVQIERAVIFGSGPTRYDAGAGPIAAGSVNADECALLRRLARIECDVEFAETLFRIKDATLDGDNAPDWAPLFVDTICRILKQGTPRPGLIDPTGSFARFIAQMPAGLLVDAGWRPVVTEPRLPFVGQVGPDDRGELDPLERKVLAALGV